MTFDAESAIEETPPSGGRELVVAYLPQIWVFTIGALNFAALSRLLGTEVMGSYAICTVYVLLLLQLFLLGSEYGTQYFMMAKKITVSETFTLNVIYSTAAAVLSVGSGLTLVWLEIGFLDPFFGKAPRETLYLSMTMLFPLALGHALIIQLSGLRRYGILARVQLFRSLAQAGTVLTLVWALDLGLNGAILALTASHIVMVTLLLRELGREYGTKMALPRKNWLARTIGYGVRANPLHLGMSCERRMGLIGLGLVASGSDVGVFNVAISHVTRLADIPHVVGVVIYPKLFGDDSGAERSDSAHVFSLWLRLTGAIMVAVAAALVVFSWPGVLILHGRAYLGAVTLLWILAPGLVAWALCSVLVPYFNSIEQPGVTSWSMGIGLLVNLACLVILLPGQGIEGVAIALTAGILTRMLVLAVMFHRATKLRFASVWIPRRSDLGYLWAILRDARQTVRVRKAP